MRETFNISFGKVSYPDASKKGRWVWMCTCRECEGLELSQKLHGPFKTLRQAERDAESTVSGLAVLLSADDDGGMRH